MLYQRRTRDTLPGWLWFFVLLPIGLVFLLVKRRGRPLRLPPRKPLPRYIEPDSIPLNMTGDEGVRFASRMATGATEELIVNEEMAVEEAAESETQAQTQPSGAAAAAEEADNLKIVEGIGPSIAGILRENGIRTFRQLAQAPVEQLVEILTRAKLNRLANPATWPEQARLAAEGKWEELTAYQQTLKGGRRRSE